MLKAITELKYHKTVNYGLGGFTTIVIIVMIIIVIFIIRKQNKTKIKITNLYEAEEISK